VNLQPHSIVGNGRCENERDDGCFGIHVNLFGMLYNTIFIRIRGGRKAEFLGVQLNLLHVGRLVDGKVNGGDSLKGKGDQIGRQVQFVSENNGMDTVNDE
jgi:hypothetical protein